MEKTISIEKTETEFLENVIGETEMIRDYAPEMVIDSIENMCQERLELIEKLNSTDLENKIKMKMRELIDLVPEGGYLTITGFDEDELTVLKKKGIGIYGEFTKVQSSKVQG